MRKNVYNLKGIGIMVMVALFTCNLNAQDARITQSFYASPLKVNPAIMGMNTHLKAILNYRSQWGIVDEGYSTGSFTLLYPLYMKEGKQKLDIGINTMNDKSAIFSTMDYSLALGYTLKLSDAGFMSLSLMGGYIQKSIDASNLNFDDQYVMGSFDASNPTNANIASENVGYPDVGFGMMWFFNSSRQFASRMNLYAGVSGYHLNEPNETMVGGSGKLPKKVSFQAGFKVLGANQIDFSPNFSVSTQGGAEDFAAGLYIDYNMSESAKIIFGSWYRKNDGYAALLAFEHQRFMVGYSYDITTSEIGKYISGLNTHEITLTYKMNIAEKKGIEVGKSMF